MSEPLARLTAVAPDSLGAQRAVQEKASWRWIPLNLMWTLWYVGDLLYSNLTTAWIVATVLGFSATVVVCLLGFSRPRRALPYFGALMLCVGAAVVPWNASGGVTSFIYAGVMVSNAAWRPARAVLALVFVATLFVAQTCWLGWPTVLIASMTALIVSIGAVNFAHSANARKDAELRLSHAEVRRLAATAERERIGRDLHDLLGHTLSLIALKSELANKLLARDVAAAQREIAEVERVARDALAQVRHAVTGIRSAGFAAELAAAKLLLESNGVCFDYTLAHVPLPADVETALAMCVREAVTNIQRHARATQASVALEAAPGGVSLSIADNGRGGAIVPGNGLTGMRERLAAIGAQLAIESQHQQGTRLVVTAPLASGTAAP